MDRVTSVPYSRWRGSRWMMAPAANLAFIVLSMVFLP